VVEAAGVECCCSSADGGKTKNFFNLSAANRQFTGQIYRSLFTRSFFHEVSHHESEVEKANINFHVLMSSHEE
jgi:hypothetical protein